MAFYEGTDTTARRQRGFSLIEVMVAIVILTVGLLSLAQMMVLATNSNMLSGRMTSSSSLAKEQLERLKATPFYSDVAARTRSVALQPGGSLTDSEAGYVQFFDSEGQPVDGPGDALYEVRWQITDVPTAMPLEMVRIDVRCMPAGGEGSQFAVIGEARFTTFRTSNVA